MNLETTTVVTGVPGHGKPVWIVEVWNSVSWEPHGIGYAIRSVARDTAAELRMFGVVTRVRKYVRVDSNK